ncbi:hypothetical protein MtrunA17_Chr1g0147061 [Medicago truncatula]|uniref:Uncharacterized protein n=1 Tax=Medicago truncatula TaxID=3880 RepID=A0A396JER4_MEDTR|nr:hypothetical protein MtrunA17_Chr1g0147061 [Medicago truncatula]
MCSDTQVNERSRELGNFMVKCDIHVFSRDICNDLHVVITLDQN